MKIKSAFFCAALLGLALLSGCSPNQYELHYQGIVPREALGQYQVCDEPGLWTGESSIEAMLDKAADQGLVLVGTSVFQRSNSYFDQAVSYGKTLGACLVYVDESYARTERRSYNRTVVVGKETLTMRDADGNVTGTVLREITKEEEVPYTVTINEYTAYYFAKPLDPTMPSPIQVYPVPTASRIRNSGPEY